MENKILICNNEKQNKMNKTIVDRTFNIVKHRPNLVDFRTDHFICNKYTDLNKDNKDLSIDYNKLNTQQHFFPGNGSSVGFLKNIDVDSNVKNIGVPLTFCKKKRSEQGVYLNRIDDHFKNTVYMNKGSDQLWNKVTKRKCCKN